MCTNKIVYYDTIIDSYNEILLLGLKRISPKAFFVINEIVYLIDFSQYIYQSADHLATWSNIGESVILASNAPIISTILIYNQKVYFANYYAIYSFSLMKTKIKKIINLTDF
ncbi:unnamed protein product [Blepharisma stoltei]|uniref:Uncharacterized protein n=1 Tax=Blepharisma stoltei TaxID=1481888 RepID=A0AAU9JDQ6_9CILI|nr:unnamed protein product [Blepharisma stoltei]